MPCVGAEQALAPGAQEVAIAIKDNHRVLAAVEDVHVVLRVHRDASHVDELPARRKLSQFSTGVKSSMPLPTTVAIMCLLMSEKSGAVPNDDCIIAQKRTLISQSNSV